MAPDVRRFPVRDLPVEIQANPSGRKRKMPSGSDVGLETCKLFTVSQYACEVHDEKESGGDGRVHCHEVVRYFRKCMDKKGHFTVETTTWETQESVERAMAESNRPKGNAGGKK